MRRELDRKGLLSELNSLHSSVDENCKASVCIASKISANEVFECNSITNFDHILNIEVLLILISS